MGGYKFKLQKILEYKETVEGLKKSEYSVAIQKLNEEEEILSEYISRKSQIIKDREGKDGRISVGSLKLYNDYIVEITGMIEKQELVIDRAERLVEVAQQNLLEAMQEKKGFEKLKERDYEEFIEEEKREEAKMIDQIVTFNTNTQ